MNPPPPMMQPCPHNREHAIQRQSRVRQCSHGTGDHFSFVAARLGTLTASGRFGPPHRVCSDVHSPLRTIVPPRRPSTHSHFVRPRLVPTTDRAPMVPGPTFASLRRAVETSTLVPALHRDRTDVRAAAGHALLCGGLRRRLHSRQGCPPRTSSHHGQPRLGPPHRQGANQLSRRLFSSATARGTDAGALELVRTAATLAVENPLAFSLGTFSHRPPIRKRPLAELPQGDRPVTSHAIALEPPQNHLITRARIPTRAAPQSTSSSDGASGLPSRARARGAVGSPQTSHRPRTFSSGRVFHHPGLPG